MRNWHPKLFLSSKIFLSFKTFLRLGIVLTVSLNAFSNTFISQAFTLPPFTASPKTQVEPVIEVMHGVKITDPYRWLENQNDPNTRKWIEAQNDYTKSIIGNLPEKVKIKKRLAELMKVDTINVPFSTNGYYFFLKMGANEEQKVLYVRKGAAGQDTVLVDPHPLSKAHTTSVVPMGVSKDGTIGAYGIREGGEDEVILKLMNVNTRRNLPDRFEKRKYWDVVITPSKDKLYYTVYTKEGPRVFCHFIGRDPSYDEEIFGSEYGPDNSMDIRLSDDGHYLLVAVFHGWQKSDLFVLDLVNKTPAKTIVRGVDASFIGKFAGDHLVLLSTWRAPNGQIFYVDLHNPERENWKRIIPESFAAIEDFQPAGGKIIVSYMENAVSVLKLYNTNGSILQDIPFPSLGAVQAMSGSWEENEFFYEFAAFNYPSAIYKFDLPAGKQEIWAKAQVSINSGDFEVKQVWYSSKDETSVPMFLVHKKGIKIDGAQPTLLTGYGGFNVNMTPWFSPLIALWIENGGVFALPALRGGGEFGEKWHKAGMLDKKQNVFDDFIFAAQWLIKNKYTNPSKLAISGGSNGGLLVGAALTQRPELFKAVVCTYPLLDMLRYHKFLMGKLWVPEYGSSEDPAQFKYLYEYSPYHQVKTGVSFPSVMFVTGDSDTRVDPLHARKMTALLQSVSDSKNLVLLRYDTKAGHSAGIPIGQRIDELADELTFLFWQLETKIGK